MVKFVLIKFSSVSFVFVSFVRTFTKKSGVKYRDAAQLIILLIKIINRNRPLSRARALQVLEIETAITYKKAHLLLLLSGARQADWLIVKWVIREVVDAVREDGGRRPAGGPDLCYICSTA